MNWLHLSHFAYEYMYEIMLVQVALLHSTYKSHCVIVIVPHLIVTVTHGTYIKHFWTGLISTHTYAGIGGNVFPDTAD